MTARSRTSRARSTDSPTFTIQDAIDGLVRERRARVFFAPRRTASAPRSSTAADARAARAGANRAVVDISADFRFADRGDYERVYGHAHGAPQRHRASSRAPCRSTSPSAPTPHVAHPGLFHDRDRVAAVPFLALDLVEAQIFVAAVTGSSGAGSKPDRRHPPPERHSDLYAYGALAHRHEPEIARSRAPPPASAARSRSCRIGPVRPRHPRDAAGDAQEAAATRRSALAALQRATTQASVRRVHRRAAALKDVVASNYARLSAAAASTTRRRDVRRRQPRKGAAGGAVQWMNRLFGFDGNRRPHCAGAGLDLT